MSLPELSISRSHIGSKSSPELGTIHPNHPVYRVINDYTHIPEQREGGAKIFIRLRPLLGLDRGDGSSGFIRADGTNIAVKNPEEMSAPENVYRFNGIFPESISQDSVFQSSIKPLVEHTIHGYNSCVFAYGKVDRISLNSTLPAVVHVRPNWRWKNVYYVRRVR
jgi:hypothetical protein